MAAVPGLVTGYENVSGGYSSKRIDVRTLAGRLELGVVVDSNASYRQYEQALGSKPKVSDTKMYTELTGMQLTEKHLEFELEWNRQSANLYRFLCERIDLSCNPALVKTMALRFADDRPQARDGHALFKQHLSAMQEDEEDERDDAMEQYQAIQISTGLSKAGFKGALESAADLYILCDEDHSLDKCRPLIRHMVQRMPQAGGFRGLVQTTLTAKPELYHDWLAFKAATAKIWAENKDVSGSDEYGAMRSLGAGTGAAVNGLGGGEPKGGGGGAGGGKKRGDCKFCDCWCCDAGGNKTMCVALGTRPLSSADITPGSLRIAQAARAQARATKASTMKGVKLDFSYVAKEKEAANGSSKPPTQAGGVKQLSMTAAQAEQLSESEFGDAFWMAMDAGRAS